MRRLAAAEEATQRKAERLSGQRENYYRLRLAEHNRAEQLRALYAAEDQRDAERRAERETMISSWRAAARESSLRRQELVVASGILPTTMESHMRNESDLWSSTLRAGLYGTSKGT